MEQAKSVSFEECGREQTDEQLRQTIAGLKRLPVGRDSWVLAFARAMERELERREEERWQGQSEAG